MTNNTARCNRLSHALILFLSLLIFISFWLFSRFTVDDAFISWRYGKNLVDFGIWNYNPAVFDMTQAYTNPIYATLSIIPNYFKIDIVLFFKIFTLLTLIVFSFWFIHKAKNSLIMVLIFFTLPITFIHAFSGLETFLFVALMASLLIFLFEEKLYHQILISLLLFFTRPEAWLLVILLPLYALTIDPQQKEKDDCLIIKNGLNQLNWRNFILTFSLLFIPLVIYFIFHKLYFGNALPNTFYIKSGKNCQFFYFIWLSFLMLPIFILIPLKKFRLFIFSFLMFTAMVISYSTSELQMNYGQRFAFHIFAPIYFFIVYIASTKQSDFLYAHLSSKYFKKSFNISFQIVLNLILLSFFAVFADKVINTGELAWVSSYYPRAIDSHAELGKKLQHIANKYNLKSFSFGDAGMTAYHSKLIALDNIGLGSSAVASGGVTSGLLDVYKPDIVIFYANPQGIHLSSHYQDIIHDWSLKNGMQMICDIYWRPEYIIRVFAKGFYPEIIDVCDKSKQNNDQKDKDFLLKIEINSPWSYWKE